MTQKNKIRSYVISEYMETTHKLNHMIHKKIHQSTINSDNEFHISHEAIHVLYLISKKDGISIKKIGELNTKSRMLNWKLVKQLEDNSLIKKVNNELDKRQPLHFITPKGKTLVKNRTNKIHEVLADFLDVLTDEELKQYVEINKKLLKNNLKVE